MNLKPVPVPDDTTTELMAEAVAVSHEAGSLGGAALHAFEFLAPIYGVTGLYVVAMYFLCSRCMAYYASLQDSGEEAYA